MPLQPTPERPSIWLAVSMFTGLPVILWLYKVNIRILSLACRFFSVNVNHVLGMYFSA
ncbi:hypothetical protein SERLADRAFT_402646 [Serpula lacrymans var. lacrymans S7.9]|uniref:Uncharacterized protein n=1 Tax=Serpula lacrymans var. lacrymans (strain S7.9) TaxID=578457 RepID=F8PC69_SERL9|nr:uncharacterized protein SERLADRAFT_402646 [Serpula lacrymans var. lacrymans S7.9]EGO19269.1 hypothetical protein SERLADRAFT_402646 [Serpula lacrymans var. lacrymans S7.9]